MSKKVNSGEKVCERKDESIVLNIHPLQNRKNVKENYKECHSEKQQSPVGISSCYNCSCCIRKPTKRRRRRQTCAFCCRRTVAFFFSHIGLCSLVVAYSIAGGFIFRTLESGNEIKERANVDIRRQHFVSQLWNYTKTLNILYKPNWTKATDLLMIEYQKDIYKAIKENGWDGKYGERELQWSFTGSLLYSVTVITTIGYGNIAPKTSYGRLVTIFYAMIGIPLTLLCLANIGSLLGDSFRFIYKYICRCCIWICLPAGYFTRTQRKRRFDVIKISSEQFAAVALPQIEESTATPGIPAWNEKCNEPETIVDDESSEGGERVRVPITVCFLLMTIYVLSGAMLFSEWEDDWDYLIGSYFCFITLSTIGFGDFVPGASTDSWSNKQKTVLCALYLIFGLALIAMCFNLMQEEVRTKFSWLAEKLRLVDRDKDRK